MNIAEYLKSADLSATAFAEKIGVSASTITRIVNNEQINPHFDLVSKIVRATNGMVSFGDFERVETDNKRGAGSDGKQDCKQRSQG